MQCKETKLRFLNRFIEPVQIILLHVEQNISETFSSTELNPILNSVVQPRYLNCQTQPSFSYSPFSNDINLTTQHSFIHSFTVPLEPQTLVSQSATLHTFTTFTLQDIVFTK